MIRLEICANSIQSAIHAQKGGADRIELCQALGEGGTTPSHATIRYCIEKLNINTFVLIRPRAGDFFYSDTEFEVIKKETLHCKKSGVKGVVTGFLNKDYSIDKERTDEIVRLAFPMEVTFHRAFDLCADWEIALEDIIQCGCHRILTSGMAENAELGMKTLAELHSKATGRIGIMAGSGINSTNMAQIAKQTGISEFHASCKVLKNQTHFDDVKYYPDNSFAEYWETDAEKVRELKSIIRSFQ